MARRSGFLTSLIGIVGLLALATWVFKDRIPGLAQPRAQEVEGIGPAAAQAAQDKLQRLRESGDTIHMTEAEFTSLIRYHLPGLAGPLIDPSVDFVDNTFSLNGRYPKDQIPDVPEIRPAMSILPDTADVVLQGELRTLAPGRVALRVTSGSFARIPLKRVFITTALSRFGRRDEPGLQSDEYLFTLPEGVQTARVEDGVLVLGARTE
jgi:hypothetical protein